MSNFNRPPSLSITSNNNTNQYNDSEFNKKDTMFDRDVDQSSIYKDSKSSKTGNKSFSKAMFKDSDIEGSDSGAEAEY